MCVSSGLAAVPLASPWGGVKLLHLGRISCCVKTAFKPPGQLSLATPATHGGNRPPLCLLLYNICLTCFVLVLAARVTIHPVAPLGILTICSPDSVYLRSLCLSHCLLHCRLTGQTSPATRSLTWISHSLHWLIPRSPALDFITNSALPVSWRLCALECSSPFPVFPLDTSWPLVYLVNSCVTGLGYWEFRHCIPCDHKSLV